MLEDCDRQAAQAFLFGRCSRFVLLPKKHRIKARKMRALRCRAGAQVGAEMGKSVIMIASETVVQQCG
jgi:hypothetical protein